MQRLSKVLLCKPSYFTVDYIINPLMKPHSVNKAGAMRQWQNLVDVYKLLGIEVETIDQKSDVPDMVFAVDQGIVKGDTVLLANFRHIQRRKERVYYREWFRNHGYRLRALSNVHFFEGGDARFFGDKLFVGTGFRASASSCEELAQKLAIDVVPIEITSPDFYHLDMGFLPMDEQTAFYYPNAYSPSSQAVFAEIVPNLLEFNEAAAYGMAANSVISGKDIITQCMEPEFTKALKNMGYKIHYVDVSEFNKSGGGIRCLTNVLE